jgi:hypothetical protein
MLVFETLAKRYPWLRKVELYGTLAKRYMWLNVLKHVATCNDLIALFFLFFIFLSLRTIFLLVGFINFKSLLGSG